MGSTSGSGLAPERELMRTRPILALAAMIWGCDSQPNAHFYAEPGAGAPVASSLAANVVETGELVAARAATIPTYPCSQCHDLRHNNPNKRELKDYHTTIKLEHSPAMAWCDACHTFEQWDVLHLLDGTKVSFDESYRLCGQCHGEKMRDWTSGGHGLQTGSWRGGAVKRTCTECHSPHSPKFGKLAPMPAPDRPRGMEGHGTGTHAAPGASVVAPSEGHASQP